MNLQAPSGCETEHGTRVTWVVRTGMRDALRPLMSRPLEDLRRMADARAVKSGRAGPFHLPVPGSNERVLVRPYARGGVFRRFLPSAFPTAARGLAELAVCARARELGLPVADVFGVSAEPAGARLWRVAAWSRWIAAAAPLPDAIRNFGSDRERLRGLLEKTASVLRLAHDSGLLHGDLNANNVVVAGPDAVTLVDLDRARFVNRVSLSSRRSQLRRLYRSLAKLKVIPRHLNADDFELLARGYFGPEMDPARLRCFIRTCRAAVLLHSPFWR